MWFTKKLVNLEITASFQNIKKNPKKNMKYTELLTNAWAYLCAVLPSKYVSYQKILS